MSEKEFNLNHKVEKDGKKFKVIVTNFKNKKQLNEFIKALKEDWESENRNF